MPKKQVKVSKSVAKRVAIQKKPAVAVVVPSSTDNVVPVSKQFPTFEGAQVTSIQKENDINGRFHLCVMSDGTTKHVPVDLF